MRTTMWALRSILFLIITVKELQIAYASTDICLSLCKCVNESRFVKIHCDFVESKVSHVLSKALSRVSIVVLCDITQAKTASLGV
jgi:hypothetical protein